MKRKRGRKAEAPKKIDSRLNTPPGHYLKNAPWRKDVGVPEPDARMISARDTVVLAFLVISSVAVAAALWMNPPQIIRFQSSDQAIKAQATLAGNRVPQPYNGLGYDPSKFEEVKEGDEIIQDDLEDILLEEPIEEEPAQSL